MEAKVAVTSNHHFHTVNYFVRSTQYCSKSLKELSIVVPDEAAVSQ